MEEQIKDNETVDLRGLFISYLAHWKLIMSCGLFSLVVAVAYLLLYPKTFEVEAQIIFQDDSDFMSSSNNSGGDASSFMSSFGLGGANASGVVFDDEFKTLSSNQLVREMVRELGIFVDYMEPFTFGYRMYGEEPLKVSCDSLTAVNLERTIKMEIEHKGNGEVHIDTDVKYSFFNHHKQSFVLRSLPGIIEVEGSVLHINYAKGKENVRNTDFELYVDVNPLSGVAERLIDDFKLEDYSNSSNVLQMNCTDYEPRRAKDMFSVLIACYNKQAETYKHKLANSSLVFIGERIKYAYDELSRMETKIEQYKEEREVTQVSYDIPQYAEVQSKMIELKESMYLVDMMDSFVHDSANQYKLVPMLYTPSTTDVNGSTALSAYNDILLSRERVIKNSSENNPLVGTLSAQADHMRENVFTMIENTKLSLEKTYMELKQKEARLLSKMGEFPEQERVFMNLDRERDVYLRVYLMLLNKREDVLLAMNQGKERAKVIDAPYVKSAVVAPRKLYAAIGVIVFTIFLSMGWLCSKWFVLSIWDDLKAEIAKQK